MNQGVFTSYWKKLTIIDILIITVFLLTTWKLAEVITGDTTRLE